MTEASTGRGGAGPGGAPDDRTRMRRLDRAKDDAWIRQFLRVAPLGFLATLGEAAQPYLNSNLFVFDEEERCIYLHTYRTGRTRANVDAHEKVAFSAAGMGRMLPASQALEFSVEYAGVVVFGVGRVVEDPEEASRGLRLLLEKYAPHLEYGVDYRGATPDELERTAVYRIDIEAWSGKQKEAPADFPGAYELPPPSTPFPRRTG
jgi:nitroimidazol reductase NimA-like FMN-containing flavoprotein (pyridoxamine 5'-phosphate oxidase superfamily)